MKRGYELLQVPRVPPVAVRLRRTLIKNGLQLAAMRTRQVLAAGVLAIATFYISRRFGQAFPAAFSLGTIVFAVVQISIATYYRARYWYQRGGRRSNRHWCPNCQQHIRRLSGDWICRCHRCGWKAGWPGLRWLTLSVPARQLYRSLTPLTLALLTVGIVFFAMFGAGVVGTGAVVPGMGPDADEFGSDTAASTPTATPTATATATATAANTGTEVATVDLGKSESLVVSMTNTRRTERGREPFDRTAELDKIAQYHSNDMAQNDYYSHDSPDGESAGDRFEMFPNTCSAAVSENIHRAEINDRMRVWNGDETIYTSDARGVARYLVKGWMNSDGHRENILRSEWSQTGVGIAVQPDGDLFATQVFC